MPPLPPVQPPRTREIATTGPGAPPTVLPAPEPLPPAPPRPLIVPPAPPPVGAFDASTPSCTTQDAKLLPAPGEPVLLETSIVVALWTAIECLDTNTAGRLPTTRMAPVNETDRPAYTQTSGP